MPEEYLIRYAPTDGSPPGEWQRLSDITARLQTGSIGELHQLLARDHDHPPAPEGHAHADHTPR